MPRTPSPPRPERRGFHNANKNAGFRTEKLHSSPIRKQLASCVLRHIPVGICFYHPVPDRLIIHSGSEQNRQAGGVLLIVKFPQGFPVRGVKHAVQAEFLQSLVGTDPSVRCGAVVVNDLVDPSLPGNVQGIAVADEEVCCDRVFVRPLPNG